MVPCREQLYTGLEVPPMKLSYSRVRALLSKRRSPIDLEQSANSNRPVAELTKMDNFSSSHVPVPEGVPTAHLGSQCLISVQSHHPTPLHRLHRALLRPLPVSLLNHLETGVRGAAGLGSTA